MDSVFEENHNKNSENSLENQLTTKYFIKDGFLDSNSDFVFEISVFTNNFNIKTIKTDENPKINKENLPLNVKISNSYFELCAILGKNTTANQINTIRLLSTDLMRAYLCFINQINKVKIISDKNGFQKLFLDFPLFIKCASYFQKEVFADFMFLFELHVDKCFLNVIDLLKEENKFCDYFYSFCSALLMLEEKCSKIDIHYSFLIDTITKCLMIITKRGLFSNKLLNVSVEFLIYLKSRKYQMNVRSKDCINNFIAYLINLLEHGKSCASNDWFSLLNIVLESFKLVFPIPQDKVSPDFFSLEECILICSDLVETFYKREHPEINFQQKEKTEYKEIEISKPEIKNENTFGTYKPYNIKIAEQKQDTKSYFLMNTLFSLFSNDAFIIYGFLSVALNNQNPFIRFILIEYFLKNITNPLLHSTDVLRTFINREAINDECIETGENSIEYIALAKTLSLFIQIIDINKMDNFRPLADVLMEFLPKSDPITYHIFIDVFIDLTKRTKVPAFLSLPNIYNGIFGGDAKFRTLIQTENENKQTLLEARGSFIEFLKSVVNLSLANTILFCDKKRTRFIFDLILEKDAKIFVTISVNNALSTAKAPFILIDTMKNWITENIERANNNSFVNIITLVLTNLSNAITNNIDKCIDAIILSNFDIAICESIKYINDKDMAKRYFQSVIHLLTIAANLSYIYIHRLNTNKILETFLKYTDKIKITNKVLSSIFNLMIGRSVDFKGNLGKEQIIVRSAILLLYEISLNTDMHNDVIKAFVSLSELSVTNRYQMFKVGMIEKLIDHINEYGLKTCVTKKVLLTKIASSFFHKKQLAKLFDAIVNPKEESGSFFAILLNIIIDQQNQTKPDAFFHVSNSELNFERKGPLSNQLNISFNLRYEAGEGNIITIKANDKKFSVSYINNEIYVSNTENKEIAKPFRFKKEWNLINIKVSNTLFEMSVNNERFITQNCSPISSSCDDLIQIGGVICDIEDIIIESGKQTSKYNASCTRDYKCIDCVGSTDAVFKGLIILFSPSVFNTLVTCGGPIIALPFFEAVRKTSDQGGFLLTIIDFLIQMTAKALKPFANQHLYQCLNASLRKFDPSIFSPLIVTKLISLYEISHNKTVQNEMEEFIFSDPSIIIRMSTISKEYLVENEEFSEFSLVLCELEKVFNNFYDGTNKLDKILTNILTLYDSYEFKYKDAMFLAQQIISLKGTNYASAILKIIDNRIKKCPERILPVFSSFHFYLPFISLFSNVSLQRETLSILIKLKKKLPKNNDEDLLNAVKSITDIMKDVDSHIFNDIFVNLYGNSFSFDTVEDSSFYPMLPLICRLIGDQKEETRKKAVKFIRLSISGLTNHFRGWETFLLYLMQMDESPKEWITILFNIQSNKMKSYPDLFILFEVVISLTYANKEEIIEVMIDEFNKFLNSNHEQCKDCMESVLKLCFVDIETKTETPKVFTSFKEFITAIDECDVVINRIPRERIVKQRCNLVSSLLKAVATDGVELFANENIVSLFTALFFLLHEANKEMAINVADFIFNIVVKSTDPDIYQKPVAYFVFLINDYEQYTNLNAFIGCFDYDPQFSVESFKESCESAIKFDDEIREMLRSVVQKSHKSDEEISEDKEMIEASSHLYLPYFESVRNYIENKHIQNDIILSKALKNVQRNTSSLWKNTSSVYRKFSKTVDMFGRHSIMLPIKTFNPHKNALFEAHLCEEKVIKPFLNIDNTLIANKITKVNNYFGCSRVIPKGVYRGKVFVLKNTILFQGDTFMDTIEESEIKKPVIAELDLKEITCVLWRKYELENCAVEVFTKFDTPIFFVLESTKERNNFIDSILKQGLPNARIIQKKHIIEAVHIKRLTQMWNERALTNYEYIYWINMFAGRSFNDITQYPVFPWIIKDYDSPTLNIDDPNTFRDLSKMIGELNEERLKECKNEALECDLQFGLYKIFYSNPCIIINYLVRCEPFTTLNIELQGGHFDNPNRMFSSIKQYWECVIGRQSDFRELIPEFFTTPFILENKNGYNFGVKEDGMAVDDVELPPWCKNAYEFIAMHRYALESCYVSRHINEWIDNMFGYRQGKLEYNNLFSKYTYPENFEEITPNIKNHGMNFGISPQKLFNEPHPVRSESGFFTNSYSLAKSLELSVVKTTAKIQKLVGLAFENGIIYALNVDGELFQYNAKFTQQQKIVISQFYGEKSEMNKHCNILPSKGTVIYSAPWCTYFDIYNFQAKKERKGITVQNEFRITALHAKGDLIAAGFIDSSVVIIQQGAERFFITDHTNQIVDVAVSDELNVVASVDLSNTLIISVPSIGSIASCQLEHEAKKIILTDSGYIIVIERSEEGAVIENYDTSCVLISKTSIESDIICAISIQTHDFGQFLAVATKDKNLYVFRIHDFAVVSHIQTEFRVISMAYSRRDNSFVLVQENSEFVVINLK